MNRFSQALRALVLAAVAPFYLASAQAQAPTPPEIAARSYLVLDVTANQTLAQKDIDTQIEPASLTKLMTAYLVFDALKARKITLTQTLPVGERASKIAGSRMFIDSKMQVPVDDLIKGMIVQSGNDATDVLAQGVGGTVDRFVQMMNDQARALGMKNTSFKNPQGLPEPGHVSTARDLGVLATRLIRDFPEELRYFATKKYRYPGTPSTNDTNHNTLLFRDPTVDGLMAGHTDAAGYGLVATARRDFPNLTGGRRLVGIVLGTSNENARANEAQKLLNWGFTAYDDVRLFDAAQPVATPRVWKGKSDVLKLGRFEPIVVAVPSGTASKITTQVARPDPLVAPFTKNQSVGSLKVMLGDQKVADLPLVALEPVEQAGVLGRTWDAVRLWIK